MNQQNDEVEAQDSRPAWHSSSKKLLKVAVVGMFLAACGAYYFSSSVFSQTASRNRSNSAARQRSGDQRTEHHGDRFDYVVRADFFAGLAGDQAAFDRAMKACEEALATNPKHAGAMVWHGSGLLFRAGQAFQKGDLRSGGQLWDRGLEEMDTAVALEPDNIGIRVARGTTLLGASHYVPDRNEVRAMVEKGLADYELVLEAQKPYFNKLSAHARGELLFGLAEGWDRLGNRDRARIFFERIVNEAKGSGREKEAAIGLEKGTLAGAQIAKCTGCHAK